MINCNVASVLLMCLISNWLLSLCSQLGNQWLLHGSRILHYSAGHDYASHTYSGNSENCELALTQMNNTWKLVLWYIVNYCLEWYVPDSFCSGKKSIIRLQIRYPLDFRHIKMQLPLKNCIELIVPPSTGSICSSSYIDGLSSLATTPV